MSIESRKSSFAELLGLAALGVALHAAPAAAASYSVGDLAPSASYTQMAQHLGSFEDIFNFHLDVSSDIVGAIASLNMGFSGLPPLMQIDNSAMSLFSSADPLNALASGTAGLLASNLVGGDYFIKVTGNADGQDGGAYVFGLSAITAAVPEPEQWILLVAGLAAVGSIVRRKTAIRQSGVAES